MSRSGTQNKEEIHLHSIAKIRTGYVPFKRTLLYFGKKGAGMETPAEFNRLVLDFLTAPA
jgi:hypothetical protein